MLLECVPQLGEAILVVSLLRLLEVGEAVDVLWTDEELALLALILLLRHGEVMRMIEGALVSAEMGWLLSHEHSGLMVFASSLVLLYGIFMM